MLHFATFVSLQRPEHHVSCVCVPLPVVATIEQRCAFRRVTCERCLALLFSAVHKCACSEHSSNYITAILLPCQCVYLHVNIDMTANTLAV